MEKVRSPKRQFEIVLHSRKSQKTSLIFTFLQYYFATYSFVMSCLRCVNDCHLYFCMLTVKNSVEYKCLSDVNMSLVCFVLLQNDVRIVRKVMRVMPPFSWPAHADGL
jgi:hypothetical protein